MELVIVIVLLGVLGAFAVSRFANLGNSARIASINHLAGSLREAVTLVHGACRTTTGCIVASVQDKTVNFNGKNYALAVPPVIQTTITGC